jgi:beta-aspartyl-peptidase (threonine type)
LIVHAGAGNRRPSKAILRVISGSISEGYRILEKGGSASDAVIESISILENSGIANAGAGGYLQFDGTQRLDAAVMEGEELRAGSVIGLEGIRNPIQVARLVMDSPHVMFSNIGARRLAERHHLVPLPPPSPGSLKILAGARKNEKIVKEAFDNYFSTVGAAALDRNRNLAAGTSTGGTTAMLPGRVGDTPIIGAGLYADNSLGAVSCTGKGESILRIVLAKEVSMNLGSLTPLQSAHYSLKRIIQIKGEAGVIVLDRRGRFTIAHTTEYMASGYKRERGKTIIKESFKRILF